MSDIQPVKVRCGRKMALLVILAIVLVMATGFMWAHKKVQIVADDVNIAVSTLYSNPEDVLAQAGVILGANDEYRLSTATLVNGTTIALYRAVPVTVTYQGKDETLLTGKPTVGELAASLGMLQPNITLVPDEQTRIQSGMHIKATILSEKLVDNEAVEPYPVIHQPDSTLEKGVEEVREEGRDGTKIVTTRLRFADGIQVATETVSEKSKEAPVARIIHVGTRDTIETSRGAMRFKRVEYMEATAYNPTDGSGAGITASGIPARRGIVAVDPAVIALGSRVYVSGYGSALAADTGGDIVGNRIDLCMEGYSEAWNYGRRMVKVYVLE
jgi:3D (Asp-Asp-Asp) domain-containing protein